jgi:hypothetical protein
MLTQENIREFLEQRNYDLRISGNGRWIDQKCASDVVTVVADCILNYGLAHEGAFFTTQMCGTTIILSKMWKPFSESRE